MNPNIIVIVVWMSPMKGSRVLDVLLLRVLLISVLRPRLSIVGLIDMTSLIFYYITTLGYGN